MASLTAVITDFDYGDNAIERGILEPVGIQVIALQAKSEGDLLSAAADCDAMINQYARVGAKTIAAMTRCKVIARYGVGVDIVDVDAATKRGIVVTNVRDYCTEEVADHAIALWLTLARKLPQYDRATHQGIWRWQSGAPINRIRGQVMGIVSFGKIGQTIAQRAKAFGVEIIVYDPYQQDEVIIAHSAKKVSKEELLNRSNIIMMQVPMTPETQHFLSVKEFSTMQPGVIIVNTGRGPTIDNKALYMALRSGTVAGAGLDDPEEEPAKRAQWSPRENPLFSHPNVIVTPHAAYYSEQSIRLARETAASEVRRVLTGQRPLYPVNSVQLANGEISITSD